MNSWMRQHKKADGPLYLGRFADPTYFLLKPITWEPDAKTPKLKQSIVVPIGFVTDFASIPQIFWSALRPDGLYAWAAVLHDYLYWDQSVARADADEIFKVAMDGFGVPNRIISAMYRSVQLFGGKAWSDNREAKARGERRVLVKFPSDPSATWENWKKDQTTLSE